jgi:DNA-binding NarL/FixJ family response regulator
MLEESLRLIRSLGDKRGEAFALSCLSTILHDRGDGAEADALLKESIRLYREIGENSDITGIMVIKEEVETYPASCSESPTVTLVRPTELLFPFTYEELTTREIEVLRLISTGVSNKRIAEQLVISPHTVQWASPFDLRQAGSQFTQRCHALCA